MAEEAEHPVGPGVGCTYETDICRLRHVMSVMGGKWDHFYCFRRVGYRETDLKIDLYSLKVATNQEKQAEADDICTHILPPVLRSRVHDPKPGTDDRGWPDDSNVGAKLFRLTPPERWTALIELSCNICHCLAWGH